MLNKLASVLNQAPRHEDVLGSGGESPRIRNLGTGLRAVASFTPRTLYPWELVPVTTRLDAGRCEQKILYPWRKSNPYTPVMKSEAWSLY
jgi:hypothetical protein